MSRKRTERLYDVTVETGFYKILTIRAANKTEAAKRAISIDCEDYLHAVTTEMSPGEERIMEVNRLPKQAAE